MARTGWLAGDMRCRCTAIACGLVLVAMGSGASVASAGPITVRMTMGEYYTEVVAYTWSEVHVRAGEDADDLTVRAAPGGVMIRARGARLRLLPVDPDAYEDVAKPCRRRSPHAVFCPLAKKSEKAERFTPQVWLFTGPGDDRVRAETGTAMWVYAPLGAGGDVASLRGGGTLWGDAGADRLRLRTRPRLSGSLEAGAGDDVLSGDGELSGGAGADALLGSRRANTLKPGTGRDLVDGGGGVDRLAYDGSAPVRVDLPRAWASTVGGTARLRSVEDVVTGTGDDVLIGDGRGNDLDGGAGSNVIYAGAGDDRLAGAVAGGACGSGVDTVRVPENGDLKAYEDYYTGEITPPSAARLTRPLPLDCERAEMDYFGVIRPRPRVVGQQVEFLLVRPSAWRYVLTWELRAGWRPGGRLLGKRELDGRTRRIAIPVDARGRRCIATTSCRVSLTVGVDSARDDAAASILPLLL